MFKKSFLISFICSIFIFSSCSNIVTSEYSNFSFSIGSEIASDINKNISKSAVINDESVFIIKLKFNGIELDPKTVSVKKSDLKNVNIDVNNVPLRQEFSISTEITFNDCIVYKGESLPVVLNNDNNEKIVISLNKCKSSIIYEYNEGAPVAGQHIIDEYFITDNVVFPNVERNGYNFIGWYSHSSCEEKYRVTKLGGDNYIGNVTLYAKWELIPSSITFSAPNATVTADVNSPDILRPITGILKKDGAKVASFVLNSENNKSTKVENLKAGSYTVSFESLNKNETYSCNDISLNIADDVAVSVNVVPNNCYFVKAGEIIGRNGTEAKPLATVADVIDIIGAKTEPVTIIIDGAVAEPKTVVINQPNNITIRGYGNGPLAPNAGTIEHEFVGGTGITIYPCPFKITAPGCNVTFENITVHGSRCADGTGINICGGTLNIKDGTKFDRSSADYSSFQDNGTIYAFKSGNNVPKINISGNVSFATDLAEDNQFSDIFLKDNGILINLPEVLTGTGRVARIDIPFDNAFTMTPQTGVKVLSGKFAENYQRFSVTEPRSINCQINDKGEFFRWK